VGEARSGRAATAGAPEASEPGGADGAEHLREPGERVPPGPRGLPWLGNGPAFRRDQLGFLVRLHRRFGAAASVALPGARRLFFFAAPEAIGHVLVENARNFTSREINHPSMPFLGDGLLNLDGELHREQRAMVQPAFGRRRVEAYGRRAHPIPGRRIPCGAKA
jgi:cytochrome P450